MLSYAKNYAGIIYRHKPTSGGVGEEGWEFDPTRKLEPNMLKFLPIIPSSTLNSHKIYP